ncbi:MAG: threonine synthase [Pyrinomonadaceae bacterium]
MSKSTFHNYSSVQRCIEPTCRATYNIDARHYTCQICDGLLEIESDLTALAGLESLKEVWISRRQSQLPIDRSGVWRFRELLPFAELNEVVSLEEGNTPLYDAPRTAEYAGLQSLRLKHQGNNPTCSFKDTGMTAAVTQAVVLGSELVMCASTGNTAASLAAYAARAGLSCAILVPTGQVSHAKLAQALDYGAIVLEIDGNFDTCMRLVREFSTDEDIYLVNSINPFRIEGQKTVAAELAEQLDWKLPDYLIVPGGNLGNSSAFGKGFRELHQLKLMERMPEIIVVQAEGAAPFARYFEEVSTGQTTDLIPDPNPRTLASAIKIGDPVSWKKAWRAVRETRGRVITVTETEIADAKAIVGRDGIGCEPASATTVAGIRKLVTSGLIDRAAKVVAVLTGHVLKDTDYVINYHKGSLKLPGIDHSLAGKFSNEPIRVAPVGKEIRAVLRRLQH